MGLVAKIMIFHSNLSCLEFFFLNISVLFRNFGLLSFGEEAEEDEAETNQYVQKNAAKPKSVHDVGDDPSLSKQTLAIEKKDDGGGGGGGKTEERTIASDDEDKVKEKTDRIRSKLMTAAHNKKKDEPKAAEASDAGKAQQSDSDDDLYGELERERKMKRQKEA